MQPFQHELIYANNENSPKMSLIADGTPKNSMSSLAVTQDSGPETFKPNVQPRLCGMPSSICGLAYRNITHLEFNFLHDCHGPLPCTPAQELVLLIASYPQLEVISLSGLFIDVRINEAGTKHCPVKLANIQILKLNDISTDAIDYLLCHLDATDV